MPDADGHAATRAAGDIWALTVNAISQLHSPGSSLFLRLLLGILCQGQSS